MAKFILDALLFIVQLTPLLVLGSIIIIAGYFCFVSRMFRRSRIPMGASFILGILTFVIPVVVHSSSDSGISWWGIPKEIMPFSTVGLLIYGGLGLVCGFFLITLVQIYFNRPQALVVGLVGASSFLLFYYFFAIKSTSEAVSMLAFGMLIGVLFHVIRLENDDLSSLLKDDEVY